MCHGRMVATLSHGARVKMNAVHPACPNEDFGGAGIPAPPEPQKREYLIDAPPIGPGGIGE